MALCLLSLAVPSTYPVRERELLQLEDKALIGDTMLLQPGISRRLVSATSETVWLRCLRKLARSPHASKRSFTADTLRRTSAVLSRQNSSGLAQEYFLANDIFETRKTGLQRNPISKDRNDNTKSAVVEGSSNTNSNNSSPTSSIDGLPHRRRQRRAQRSSESDLATESYTIPPDASSRLTTASTSAPPSSLRRRLALFLSLSKPRLTFLVVLTAATPYGLYPIPDILSAASIDAPSLSALTLLFLTTGTSLAIASANTFNMLAEPQYDARMSRTRNRPLVRKLISSQAAAMFGIITGVAGVTVLYFGCNPTTAFLGGANILLYAAVYTPLKRMSTINTWIGAIVGAIPPLMGWTAAAGQYATSADSYGGWKELLLTPQAEGGWWLAALLFAWQFPHFNALSHTIREEYANAGYKMMCSINPARNARVALRYSLLMFPICYGLLASGVVGGASLTAPSTVLWAAGSSAINGWMTVAATKFWWHQGARGTARGLFWASVWHMPILLVLAMAVKRGVWARVAESLGFGSPDSEEDDFIVEGASHVVKQAEQASTQSSM